MLKKADLLIKFQMKHSTTLPYSFMKIVTYRTDKIDSAQNTRGYEMDDYGLGKKARDHVNAD